MRPPTFKCIILLEQVNHAVHVALSGWDRYADNIIMSYNITTAQVFGSFLYYFNATVLNTSIIKYVQSEKAVSA